MKTKKTTSAEETLSGLSERLLSVTQVAERLGLSKHTVYILCGRGEIPSTRIANRIRVPQAALEQFVQDHMQTNHH